MYPWEKLREEAFKLMALMKDREAAAKLEAAVQLAQEAHGEQSGEVMALLGVLPAIYMRLGDRSKLLPIRRRFFDALKADISNGTLKMLLCDLAYAYYMHADYELAGEIYDEWLDLLEANAQFGGDDRLKDLMMIGEFYQSPLVFQKHGTRLYPKAERIQKQILALVEKIKGADHLDSVDPLYALAQLYHSWGRLPEAEVHYRRALTILEKSGCDEINYDDYIRVLKDQNKPYAR